MKDYRIIEEHLRNFRSYKVGLANLYPEHPKRQFYVMTVEAIERAVDVLSEEDQLFVRMKYFQGSTNVKISEEMGYSLRQLTRIRRRVLNQLSISLAHLCYPF